MDIRKHSLVERFSLEDLIMQLHNKCIALGKAEARCEQIENEVMHIKEQIEHLVREE